MIKLLLTGHDKNRLFGLVSALSGHDEIQMEWAESGVEALNLALSINYELVVADENLGDMSGITFARRLLSVNPMINCAIVSPLPTEEFHNITEGLGILAQLPVRPGKHEAKDLILRLKKILGLMAGKGCHAKLIT